MILMRSKKMLEQLLQHLAAEYVTDVEAYWILWIRFYQIFKICMSIRSIFVEGFLLWKVFPVCCLRWILHLAVFECSSDDASENKGCNARSLFDTVQCLVLVCCKQEFEQSKRLEQQAYATKDAIRSILEGVSCRLGSPDDLVRKMASSIGFVFLNIVDPQNPLYLDDNRHGENVDWEFGFPQYAAAFMLPAMQGFDKKRQGVDLLGKDYIVLGKLIYMLGVSIKCVAMHPEAPVLASPLLDMISIREISQHTEAYVRRSALFAASCILVALHPSYVASALVMGNTDIPKGLEWIRIWAHQVAEADSDQECYVMAMICLQLHSEMALQESRALEQGEEKTEFGGKLGLPSPLAKGIIKLPHMRNIEL